MNYFFKLRLTQVLAVLFCVMTFCLAPTIGHGVSVNQVYIREDMPLNEFAKDAPAVTIRIDYDQFKNSKNSKNMTAWVNEDYGFWISENGIPDGFPLTLSFDQEHDFVMYTPGRDKKSSWPQSETDSRIIPISSTDGPLFSFTFKDAAELANGEKADVVVSCNDICFYLSTDSLTSNELQLMKSANYSVASGVLFRPGNTLEDNKKYNYGVIAKIHIDVQQGGNVVPEIIFAESGAKEPATFMYTITDIDVNRKGSSFTNLTEAYTHKYF